MPASRWQSEMIPYLSLQSCAPVAQLDRAVASEATGREFESLRAHQHFSLLKTGALYLISCTHFCEFRSGHLPR